MNNIGQLIEMLNDRLDDMETAVAKKDENKFYMERGLYQSLTKDPSVGTMISQKDLQEVARRYREVNNKGMQIFKEGISEL